MDNLKDFLDNCGIDNKWLQNIYVNWYTGEPKEHGSADESYNTHCSAFVASICTKLGIEMLRPPEHNTEGLANAQTRWLEKEGHKYGWCKLVDQYEAQSVANEGKLVIVCCRNDNDWKSGHIAIVRPCLKSRDEIEKYGVQICQAGLVNSSNIVIGDGFNKKNIIKCKYYMNTNELHY